MLDNEKFIHYNKCMLCFVGGIMKKIKTILMLILTAILSCSLFLLVGCNKADTSTLVGTYKFDRAIYWQKAKDAGKEEKGTKINRGLTQGRDTFVLQIKQDGTALLSSKENSCASPVTGSAEWTWTNQTEKTFSLVYTVQEGTPDERVMNGVCRWSGDKLKIEYRLAKGFVAYMYLDKVAE